MSNVLKEHVYEKREYEKELGKALEIKLNKIKALADDYKRNYGKKFEIQITDEGKGVKGNYVESTDRTKLGCVFYFNESQIDCSIKGMVVIDPKDGEELICSYSDYKVFENDDKGYRTCVNKNLELVDKCILVKHDKYIRNPSIVTVRNECVPTSDYDKKEFATFPKSSFAWLEEADRLVDKIVPYVKSINADLREKRESVKKRLESWKDF